jgi:hypothetical protein
MGAGEGCKRKFRTNRRPFETRPKRRQRVDAVHDQPMPQPSRNSGFILLPSRGCARFFTARTLRRFTESVEPDSGCVRDPGEQGWVARLAGAERCGTAGYGARLGAKHQSQQGPWGNGADGGWRGFRWLRGSVRRSSRREGGREVEGCTPGRGSVAAGGLAATPVLRAGRRGGRLVMAASLSESLNCQKRAIRT